MSPSLYLHLGMSKTATTYLQQEVFPKLPHICFRDQPTAKGLEGGPHQGILACSFRRSPVIWDREAPSLFAQLLGAPDGVWTSRESLLISDQSAGPRLWECGRYNGSHWERERMDPLLLGAHLEKVTEGARERGFGAIKVLLVFRRQDQWLASKYAQRSDRIVGAGQEDFEKRITYYLDPRRGYYSDGIILDYQVLYSRIAAALGEENVLFLPYEMLEADAGDFLRRLGAFLCGEAGTEAASALGFEAREMRTNVRSAAPDQWMLREPWISADTTPAIAQRVFGRLRRINQRRKSIRLTPNLREAVQSAYEPCNRRLALELGLDLEPLGYYAGGQVSAPVPDDPSNISSF